MRSIQSRVDRACAIAAIASLGAGCSRELAAPIAAAHDDETPRHGGTLHLASFGDVRTLDPAVAADGLSTGAIRLIFAGLVDYDDRGEVAGDLASRFETDGTTYRFFLREGVRFHDGDEVTADDVARSIERALHPSTASPVASFFERIAGLDEYTKGTAAHLAGVSVEGRYVVSIRLREPDATFLRVLALTPLRVTCKSAGARFVDAWAPCGAGPFKLLPGGWEHGQRLTLVRHESYFRPGLPYLDAVSWATSMNIVTERFKFERGELDMIRELTQPDTMRFASDPRWRPFGEYEPPRSINGEAMNTEIPPFDNIEVRRAVACAIDREHLVLLKPSNLAVCTHPVPPGITGSNAEVLGQHYDYEEALEHMRKAGFAFDPKTGQGGYPHKIRYAVYKQSLYEFTGQAVAQDLAKIGLSLEVKTSSFPAWVALTRQRGKTALSPQGWTQDYPDPSDFLEPIFASNAINDDDSGNPSFYRNPKLDALLDRARKELDSARRSAAYAEAEQLVADDAPWAFTFSYRFFDVHQPYVRGYRVHPVWQEAVGRVWLDREPRASSWLFGQASRAAMGSMLGTRAQ